MRFVPAVFLALAMVGGRAAPASEDARLVATQEIEAENYRVTLPERVGTLEANLTVALAFEVPGRLIELAEEGREISPGDVIARLDDGVERALLRQAETRLSAARSDLTRLRSLRASNVASRTAFEDAEMALSLRRAERDGAEKQLARKRIVSRWAATLVERTVEEGEVVVPGARIATLMDLSSTRLLVQVPAHAVAQVHAGQLAAIRVSAHPGEAFEGRIRRVASAAVGGAHYFEVEIEVEDPEAQLRPGMTARAEITVDNLEAVLPVPLSAVVDRNGARVAFFVVGERARAVDVSSAAVHRNAVLVPLPTPSRTLVVRGQRELRDGATVIEDSSVLPGTRSP